VRVVLAGCGSDSANVTAAVVAPSQQVATQCFEMNRPPFALTFARRMLVESPYLCTVAAVQLELQRCAVSSRDIRLSEKLVEGMMSGHEKEILLASWLFHLARCSCEDADASGQFGDMFSENFGAEQCPVNTCFFALH